MGLEAVSFDAAGTLVECVWDPGKLAIECAEELGYPVNRESAHAIYYGLLNARDHEYTDANLGGSESGNNAFWRKQVVLWTECVGIPEEAVDPIFDMAMERLLGRDSGFFRLYDDAIPCLEALKGKVRLAVLSNWDTSLFHVLRMLEIDGYFETIIASRCEGFEKPDSRLFDVLFSRMQLQPDEIVHVGDNPVDDLRGAREVGMEAVLVCRERGTCGDGILNSLVLLPERLGL